jgi:Amt family ammonium transporter
MIMTAVLAQDVGLIAGNTSTLKAHLIGLIVVVTYTAVASYLGFSLIRKILPLEIDIEAETIGLDLHQHGEHIGETMGIQGRV